MHNISQKGTSKTKNKEVKIVMKFEIDSKNYKEFTPLGWGILTTLIWSVVLCSYSAVSGQLGTAPGIMVGPWPIGSISRYYDPFILGAIVTFTIWAWKHSPVPQQKKKNKDYYLISFFFGIFGFVLFFDVLRRMTVVSNFNDPKILFLFMVVMLFITPFGFRGMLFPFIPLSFLFWLANGLAIIAIILPILYIGKGIIWWVVNIIRYGSFDKAYNKFKGRPLESVSTVPDSVEDSSVPASTA